MTNVQEVARLVSAPVNRWRVDNCVYVQNVCEQIRHSELKIVLMVRVEMTVGKTV